MPETSSEITRILQDWNAGDQSAQERLLPFVYEELKRQARNLMFRERPSHTLQPTALVHEAFLKLAKQGDVDWQNRQHFFGIASKLMRQILVDHARTRGAAKRGSAQVHLSLEDVNLPIEARAASIIALNESLDKLAELDEDQAKVVEMRFFGGFSNAEIAESLGISERTVVRLWSVAKLWLYRDLSN